MLESVRSHQRLLMFVLLVLIVPSFVVWGIQGYSGFSEGAKEEVAVVDGRGITQAEWDAAHQRQVAIAREQMPNVDAKLFDSPAARAETLDSLVRDRVLFAAANDLRITTTQPRLQRELETILEQQNLKMADGQPDIAAYKSLLAAQGKTVESFEAEIAERARLQQVLRGVGASSVPAKSAVAAAFDALLQRREIRYARFETKDYLDRVKPTPADVEAYYKANLSEFRAPEQATIEYVVLDLETVKKGIKVNEEELRKYYAENAGRFTVAEERRARHILIKADKDAPADARQKAKARAEALLAEARKNPSGFADLAKQNSQDEGSAARGGDLDFFGRGAMVKPFEDAAYALKPGEISPVIETDFGYHIIMLEAVRGGEKKSFEDVRASIEEDVRRQLATKAWAEAAEQFTNTVEDQSDSLQPVIDKLKLQKQTATVQRTPPPGAAGPLASPKLLEAIFSSDVVGGKRNTNAIEVGPNQLASARIVQHQPARTLTLDEVRDRATAALKAQQAAALARSEGQKRLEQLRGQAPGELPNTAVVSRDRPEGLDQRALEAVLAADATKLPVPVGVDLGASGYLVARVEKVLPPELPAQQADTMKSQIADMLAQAEAQAYYDALKARYKTEVRAQAAAPR